MNNTEEKNNTEAKNRIEKELLQFFEKLKNDNSLNLHQELTLPKEFKLVFEKPTLEFCMEVYNVAESILLGHPIDDNLNKILLLILENKTIKEKIYTIINAETTKIKDKDGKEHACSMKILFEKGLLGDWFLLRLFILAVLVFPFISTLISATSEKKK